jgi:hypothetical protein
MGLSSEKMFNLQLNKLFVFTATFKLFGAKICVAEIQASKNLNDKIGNLFDMTEKQFCKAQLHLN